MCVKFALTAMSAASQLAIGRTVDDAGVADHGGLALAFGPDM